MNKNVFLFICILLFATNLMAQHPPKIFIGEIYCDSLINSGLYKTVFIDSLYLGNSLNPIISYKHLEKYFNDQSISELEITGIAKNEIETEEFNLKGRDIIYESKTIPLKEIEKIKFHKSGSVLNAFIYASISFMGAGLATTVYEGLDSLIGDDKIEWNQVLIVSCIGAVVGFITGTFGESKTIWFTNTY